MRLIDADDFKKFLQALCKAGAPYEEVVQLLDKQPTAYSVERVVAELKKLKQHNKELSEGAYLEDDKSFYFCAYTNFAKAIDIVKRGGWNDLRSI